ncbi:hypothetical protein [Variovorax guangxiensis]|uniref:hypothetical protein n=1 Tax=Variovorax guangxiensis TaxID=1775474 RepID=UPI0028679709|nr:hypothetical protein [Variovorax guangxiensis]MDR6860511.1 hypothetical protein [Variovorax guangxiensis]
METPQVTLALRCACAAASAASVEATRSRAARTSARCSISASPTAALPSSRPPPRAACRPASCRRRRPRAPPSLIAAGSAFYELLGAQERIAEVEAIDAAAMRLASCEPPNSSASERNSSSRGCPGPRRRCAPGRYRRLASARPAPEGTDIVLQLRVAQVGRGGVGRALGGGDARAAAEAARADAVLQVDRTQLTGELRCRRVVSGSTSARAAASDWRASITSGLSRLAASTSVSVRSRGCTLLP